MKTKMMIIAVMIAAMLNGSGCASGALERNRGMATGATIGAAVGTALGLMITNNAEGMKNNRVEGGLIGGATGAVIGGLGGSMIDTERENQARTEAQLQANAAAANTVIVQVPTSTGGMVQVPMARHTIGFYHGPKGEVYQFLPTAEQLKPVYGF